MAAAEEGVEVVERFQDRNPHHHRRCRQFTLNLFGTANGVFTDPTFGAVTGYTQQKHAQVLGLAPGTQVILTNNDNVPRTRSTSSQRIRRQARRAPPSPLTVEFSARGIKAVRFHQVRAPAC